MSTPERIAAVREKGRNTLALNAVNYGVDAVQVSRHKSAEDLFKRSEVAFTAALDRLIAFERAEAVYQDHNTHTWREALEAAMKAIEDQV